MTRPTIRDLAKAAGVSVSTVNRVLAGSGKVREATKKRVQDAAEAIGFYGLGSIQSRVAQSRKRYRLGFLLNQPTRTWYRLLARAVEAAACDVEDYEIEPEILFLDELTPQTTAASMLALGERCAAIAVVAAVHPLVTEAVETLREQGVPVFALISPLSAAGHVHYVGLDHWKLGRTVGWAITHLCKAPGKVGILVGNHRYRCQELDESGFRSYFREHAPDFTLLEPQSTFESKTVAQEITERMLQDHPDLAGLYVAGGGISGVLPALRDRDDAGDLVVVGYELMDVTREALLDNRLTLVISHPLARVANETVNGMIQALASRGTSNTYTKLLPFEIYTRENL